MFSSQEETQVIEFVSATIAEDALTQHTFPWLKNNTGRNMYIDAFFLTNRLALEYDGRQHREFVPFYHKTRKQFEELQARDRLKEKLLAEHDITLLRIADNEPRTLGHIQQRLAKISSRDFLSKIV